AGKGVPIPFAQTRANESSAVFSPDGRWIAYTSDESGISEVYVQPIREPFAANAPKVLVSRKGGRHPRWRAGGGELFYNSPDGEMMSVAVTGSTALRASIPRLLFRMPAASFWEVNANTAGTRFLVAIPLEQTTSQPFTVVLNWQLELAGK